MTLIHMLPMDTQVALHSAYLRALEDDQRAALKRYLETADEKALKAASSLQRKIHAARAEFVVA